MLLSKTYLKTPHVGDTLLRVWKAAVYRSHAHSMKTSRAIHFLPSTNAEPGSLLIFMKHLFSFQHWMAACCLLHCMQVIPSWVEHASSLHYTSVMLWRLIKQAHHKGAQIGPLYERPPNFQTSTFLITPAWLAQPVILNALIASAKIVLFHQHVHFWWHDRSDSCREQHFIIKMCWQK